MQVRPENVLWLFNRPRRRSLNSDDSGTITVTAPTMGPTYNIDERPRPQLSWGTNGDWGNGGRGNGDWGSGDWGSGDWDNGDWGAATGLNVLDSPSRYRLMSLRSEPATIRRQTSPSSLSSYPFQRRTRLHGAARRPERAIDRYLEATRAAPGGAPRAQPVSTQGYVRIDNSLSISNSVLGTSGHSRWLYALTEFQVTARAARGCSKACSKAASSRSNACSLISS